MEVKGVYRQNLKQNNILSLLAFFALFLYFWSSKNISSSLFCTSNDIKNVQFGFEMRDKLKMLGDKVPFCVYPNCKPIATQIIVI